jgi:hypothetical protein
MGISENSASDNGTGAWPDELQPVEGTKMRFIIGLTALTAIALGAAPANAEDHPYCLQGTQWGYPGNCQFTSYQQCLATASEPMRVAV